MTLVAFRRKKVSSGRCRNDFETMELISESLQLNEEALLERSADLLELADTLSEKLDIENADVSSPNGRCHNDIKTMKLINENLQLNEEALLERSADLMELADTLSEKLDIENSDVSSPNGRYHNDYKTMKLINENLQLNEEALLERSADLMELADTLSEKLDIENADVSSPNGRCHNDFKTMKLINENLQLNEEALLERSADLMELADTLSEKLDIENADISSPNGRCHNDFKTIKLISESLQLNEEALLERSADLMELADTMSEKLDIENADVSSPNGRCHNDFKTMKLISESLQLNEEALLESSADLMELADTLSERLDIENADVSSPNGRSHNDFKTMKLINENLQLNEEALLERSADLMELADTMSEKLDIENADVSSPNGRCHNDFKTMKLINENLKLNEEVLLERSADLMELADTMSEKLDIENADVSSPNGRCHNDFKTMKLISESLQLNEEALLERSADLMELADTMGEKLDMENADVSSPNGRCHNDFKTMKLINENLQLNEEALLERSADLMELADTLSEKLDIENADVSSPNGRCHNDFKTMKLINENLQLNEEALLESSADLMGLAETLSEKLDMENADVSSPNGRCNNDFNTMKLINENLKLNEEALLERSADLMELADTLSENLDIEKADVSSPNRKCHNDFKTIKLINESLQLNEEALLERSADLLELADTLSEKLDIENADVFSPNGRCHNDFKTMKLINKNHQLNEEALLERSADLLELADTLSEKLDIDNAYVFSPNGRCHNDFKTMELINESLQLNEEALLERSVDLLELADTLSEKLDIENADVSSPNGRCHNDFKTMELINESLQLNEEALLERSVDLLELADTLSEKLGIENPDVFSPNSFKCSDSGKLLLSISNFVQHNHDIEDFEQDDLTTNELGFEIPKMTEFTEKLKPASRDKSCDVKSITILPNISEENVNMDAHLMNERDLNTVDSNQPMEISKNNVNEPSTPETRKQDNTSLPQDLYEQDHANLPKDMFVQDHDTNLPQDLYEQDHDTNLPQGLNEQDLDTNLPQDLNEQDLDTNLPQDLYEQDHAHLPQDLYVQDHAHLPQDLYVQDHDRNLPTDLYEDGRANLPQDLYVQDHDTNLPQNLNKQDHDTNVRQDLYVCPVCHKEFESSSSFTRHTDTLCFEKTRPLYYKCDICGKAFPVQYKLDRHKKSHTDEKPYKCEECDKMFKSASSRNTHYRESHQKVPKDKNYLCSYCGTARESMEQIRAHEVTHHLPKVVPPPSMRFQCLECGKGFVSRTKLRAHQREHRPFKCRQCNGKYATSELLEKHVKTFHKTVEIFTCETCGKTFNRKQNLQMHKRNVHIVTTKQFFCEICDKGFKQKHHVEQHMISHSNDRPIPCPKCDEAFKRKSHLKQHLAGFHGHGE